MRNEIGTGKRALRHRQPRLINLPQPARIRDAAHYRELKSHDAGGRQRHLNPRLDRERENQK